MCGIAGSLNRNLDIGLLTKDLLHRGPDEQATFREGKVLLHHHRLSIVDITAGKQPMHFEHLTIIFNGEIYNHKEVREKLALQCTTNSDTETILRAFAKTGRTCLNDFDGMFAFAIYDRKENCLFLARDRAGKKPLYYFVNDTSFVFCSELNALRNQVNPSRNNENLEQFIRMGYFYKSNTPYEQVFELPAGSSLSIDINNLHYSVSKWWHIHSFYTKPLNVSFQQAVEQVDQLLHTAVKRRVESSDLEVGSFLSGGIDSGLVTAIASQYNSSLKTFTVSFAGEYDEAPLAKLVSDRYGTQHHEIKITFDNLISDVETILANYGEPFFDSSAIPSYYVSKAAKEYLTVILNGDGGDELFGGYRRYVPLAKYDFFAPSTAVQTLGNTFRQILPKPNNKKSKYNFLYRLFELASRNGVETYLTATIDSFEGFEDKFNGYTGIPQVLRTDFAEINRSNLSGLGKIMNLDFDNILAGDLLVKMDIATMAHSLEGRSPLLSKEILEYVPSLRDSFKVKGKNTKVILRKLAEKYLPADLVNQPKRGFEIPLKKWIDHELKEMIYGYLFSIDSISKDFVQYQFVHDLWNKKVNVGDEKRAKMIWTLFALEVWYKKCFKQRA